MNRQPFSNRGRGSSRGYANRGGFRGGNRGAFRGAVRGSSNSAARPSSRSATGSVAVTTPAAQRPTTGKQRLAPGCFEPNQIWDHFNPSAAACTPDQLNTINSSDENPDGAVFALVYVENQPQWMSENTVYVKTGLELLPEYSANKAVLLARHKETSQEEMMDRIAAKLSESINFARYGIEDGPDMECFDEHGKISSLVVPGDWNFMMPAHELPKLASVDTPSVKYHPGKHQPIAVYAAYGNEPDKKGFKFVAWFLVDEIELFAADSVDLARKMRHKRWSADMRREWAAVKLKRVNKGEPLWRPYPFIHRGPAKPKPSGGEKKVADATEKDGFQAPQSDERRGVEVMDEEVMEKVKESGKENENADDKEVKKEMVVKEEENVKEEEVKMEEIKEKTASKEAAPKVVSVKEEVVEVDLKEIEEKVADNPGEICQEDMIMEVVLDAVVANKHSEEVAGEEGVLVEERSDKEEAMKKGGGKEDELKED
ncbi:hypothetical protein N658DRAFT_560326 [Parathielavia hyrcaniae]|uniref:Uncharacterized protein n=1 Tax=Parathielavia hyrcaniae TaxID=113614 RepID=A0AAN6Q271_9PEZI|nr:hypothetical protein N658DRAFT_560326 [Parathielavia hyrcaniae]